MSDVLVFDTREFYKDFLSGMSINKLSKKYLISKSRVYKLIAETSREQTVNKLNRWLGANMTKGPRAPSVRRYVRYMIRIRRQRIISAR